jgi:hypothetical protein
MTGVLADAKDAAAAIDEIGLDHDFLGDIGKHAYYDPGDYAASAPGSQEADERFNSKISSLTIVSYYLSHPGQLWLGMKYTATMALSSSTANIYGNGTGLGIHALGEPVARDHHRFTLWSELRDSLPKNIWILLGILLLSLIAALAQLRGGNRGYGAAILALTAIGLFQFPLPYVFNGRCDTQKQLLVFNFTVDLLIAGIILTAGMLLIRRFTKRGGSIAQI